MWYIYSSNLFFFFVTIILFMIPKNSLFCGLIIFPKENRVSAGPSPVPTHLLFLSHFCGEILDIHCLSFVYEMITSYETSNEVWNYKRKPFPSCRKTMPLLESIYFMIILKIALCLLGIYDLMLLPDMWYWNYLFI